MVAFITIFPQKKPLLLRPLYQVFSAQMPPSQRH